MAQKGYRQRRSAKKEKNHDILGILLVVISLFLLLCIVIPVILGDISFAVFNVVLGVFGIIAYPILIAVFLLGVMLLLRRSFYMTRKNVICTVLLIFFSMIILQLASTHKFLNQNYTAYVADIFEARYSAGGVIFGTIAFGLKTAITEVACYIIFSIAIIATIVVMTDLVNRIRASKASVAPVEMAKPKPRSGFLSKSEPQRVVPVEPQNKLFVGEIVKKPVVVSESGSATEIPQSRQSRTSEYTQSPIIERYDTESSAIDQSAGRFALYGAADEINESEREEFIQKSSAEPAREFTAVPQQEAVVEPYVKVSEDAKASAAARPKKIDHVETPDMQIFFPTHREVEYNPSDDIISAEPSAKDITDGLKQDARKLTKTDIQGADPIIGAPSFTVPDFSVGNDRPAPHLEYIDDILDAPPSAANMEDVFSDVREKEHKSEQEDIIDAFAMRQMYSQEQEKAEKPEERDADDDIITDIAAPTKKETSSPFIETYVPPRSDDSFDLSDTSSDDIIDAFEPAETISAPEYRDPDDIINGIDGLSISDGPAVDLSETHDVTSDLINGDDRSGMYVSADSKADAPSPKPKQKRNGPIDNQITIEAMMQEQADESVVVAERSHRKKYDYAPPPIDLLRTYQKAEMTMDELRESAEKLEDVIGRFLKTEVKVINIVPGPTVTRYEVEVPSGVPIKQIETRVSDIEYELATISHIRVEVPIPGKRAVGIEIPNVTRSIVGLREVIESSEFSRAKSHMTVSVGKDIGGGTVLCDLVKVPHLLIAGQTGSGKSACLNGLLVSLLYKSSPEDLRFILVDPKRVEFSAYSAMPHLLFDRIIYEPEEALNALKWASAEMERRYALLAKYSRNNIASFNDLPDVTSGKIDKLPHIIIIVDELADLMQSVVKHDIEDRIKVIVAKARAAGIHLILATQRPSADVITGTIKTNLTSRIAFKVSSQIDSRIILDQIGAEALVGNGDMLFFPVDYSAARRVQGSYICDEEVVSVITYIKEHYETDFDEDAARFVFESDKGGASGAMGGGSGDGSREDSLLPDVLALIIKTGQASISGIQRRFSIGYARAARIVDSMQELGYIGPNTGNSKPREVYITVEKYREMFGRDIDDN